MSPADSLEFIERYSVVLLPVLTVTEQIGIPLPAVPALLAVGALAANGRASIPLVLGAMAIVALTVFSAAAIIAWAGRERRGVEFG